MFIVESHAIGKERKGKMMILLKSWNKKCTKFIRTKNNICCHLLFYMDIYYGISWLVFVVEYKSTF